MDSNVRLPPCPALNLGVQRPSAVFGSIRRGGWPMRPWMGALAAAAALAVLPASALAEDGQSVIEFKLPNKAAADQLIKLGYDLGDGLDQSQPGQVKATIVVSAEQKAQLEAMGYPAVHTIQTPSDVEALRAERQATIDAENAAKKALDSDAA